MRSCGNVTFISSTMMMMCLLLMLLVSSDIVKSQSKDDNGVDSSSSNLRSYLAPRQFGQRRLQQYLPGEKRGKCAWQTESCDSYTAPCCSGLKCSNYMGGYCLPKLQKCICLPDSREIY